MPIEYKKNLLQDDPAVLFLFSDFLVISTAVHDNDKHFWRDKLNGQRTGFPLLKVIEVHGLGAQITAAQKGKVPN